METEKQYCPICSCEVHPSERYPKYICSDCSDRVTDKSGNRIAFYNTSVMGYGCEGVYLDTNEKYDGDVCFVDGIECKAKEARFGGIVIQKIG